MGAVLHGPGDGERIAAGSASEILIKATSDDTGGSLFLSESTIEPGFPGPPLHRHRELHDMFYVLEGTLTVEVDGERRELGLARSPACRPGSPTPSATRATGRSAS